jgi:hypothetical protein
MWAVTFGNLRNELDSVSIAVETALPVTGHLIITKLMVTPSEFASHPSPKTMELQDHDGLTTNSSPVDKFYVIAIPPGTNARCRR